jgi:hypothetical protein
MDAGLHFGGDCGDFAGESAARLLVARPNGSVFAPWVASRREVDCFGRVWAKCPTISVSCVSPDFVRGIDAFCFAVERRSMTRFAAFPYCTRALREETSASMTNKKTRESVDCGSVQAVPGLISTIASLGERISVVTQTST